MKRLTLFLVIIVGVFNSCSEEDPVIQYSLIATTLPLEGGSLSVPNGTYAEGESVTISATASPEYVFKNWSGSATGTKNPMTIIFNSNKDVTALFEKKDDDKDEVSNELDLCSETPNGEIVDSNGCSESQLVGETSFLFDKFWYIKGVGGKEIFYSNGKYEIWYDNDTVWTTGDWVWENKSLGIIEIFNIEGAGQGWSTLWRKFNSIEEHSFKSQVSTNSIDYADERESNDSGS